MSTAKFTFNFKWDHIKGEQEKKLMHNSVFKRGKFQEDPRS